MKTHKIVWQVGNYFPICPALRMSTFCDDFKNTKIGMKQKKGRHKPVEDKTAMTFFYGFSTDNISQLDGGAHDDE